MPVAFGPSPTLPVTRGYSLRIASIPFVTDRDALASLLPRFYEPADEPIVAVNYQRCTNLDWMGGRNYNIVSVYARVRTVGLERELTATYGMVIYETDAAPIIAGREYQGTPKLFAKIPDFSLPAEELDFYCKEYDATLISGRLTNMKRVADADEIEAFNRAGDEICRLHWKYVPGLDGVPDADYPVAMYTSAKFTDLWRGEGDVEFGTPTRTEAPYSASIVEILGRLPVLEKRPATMAVAEDVEMYRNRTERLT